MTKLLDLKTGCTNTIKVKFIGNTGYLDLTNNSSGTLIFIKDEALGVVDLRSLDYYEVKQSTIQHHLKHYYEFKPLKVPCEEFNKLTNTLKTEERQSTDPYPWLAEDDERRNLTDRKILEKYIALETLCITQKEKEQLMDMLYRYKEAFSLRDEIDTCPYMGQA